MISLKKFFAHLRHTDFRNEEASYLRGVDAITHAPLPVTSQFLILSFFLLFLVVIAWASFSKIDIVSTAQGKSIPSSRIQLIQAPQLAIVESIHVKEGTHVDKGQLLVKLDKKQLDSEHRDATARVKQMQAKKMRIEALLKASQLELEPEYAVTPESAEQMLEYRVMYDSWAIYNSELHSINKKYESRRASLSRISADINRLKKLTPFSRKSYQRNLRLHKKGGITLNELEASKETLVERESSLLVLQQEHKEARAELSQVEHEVNALTERFVNELSLELVEVEQLLGNAQEELVRSNVLIAQYELRAPVAGIVKDMSINTSGGVVQAAETLMQIVPENVPLEIEAKVLNKDIGFVHKGQQVNVKVDTFNFTKYGAIPGVIKHLAQDTTEDEKQGAVYMALVELERDTIEVGSRVAKLVPGMTMSVDIHVGQRRLIEYILNPVLRYRDETLRER